MLRRPVCCSTPLQHALPVQACICNTRHCCKLRLHKSQQCYTATEMQSPQAALHVNKQHLAELHHVVHSPAPSLLSMLQPLQHSSIVTNLQQITATRVLWSTFHTHLSASAWFSSFSLTNSAEASIDTPEREGCKTSKLICPAAVWTKWAASPPALGLIG